MPGIQKSLIAQEKTSLNQVVNTLKERISLAGYAQLGYTYDDAAKPDNTFDIKRIIFMAHGKITKRWTCDFMYDFYNGGMLLEVYTDYQFLPGLTARIGEFKVPYTIENELSPTTVELINCYSQSVCYLAGVSGSDKCYGMTSGRDIGMMIHGKLFHDFLQYKVAVMNGQGLNTKDKNSQKDVVGNLMIYPLEWLSVGGSFIRGTGHAIADSEYTGIKTGENYAKKRWSAGGVVTTSRFNLCDLIIGGKEGLSPIEKTIIDRCTRLVYRDYLQDPRPENMPILGDLYDLLRKQSEPEAQNIATALEIYVNGSLNVFNHRSNIQMDHHRVLCFQLKSLGKALKEIGLLIMQDAVWNRVTANRSKHKTTWFYIDEFHLLLKGQTGSFSVEIWKRFRKWGGIPSGLTQNVKDLLASREIENIFENSDFIYMLNQAQGDRQILAKQLGISPHQLSYVTHSGPGEGLLFFGNVIIPFVDHFPKDTLLYSVLTTRPDEVAGA